MLKEGERRGGRQTHPTACELSPGNPCIYFEYLGIKPVLMTIWHCGLLPLPVIAPHSQRPSLNCLLFFHRQPWFYGWGFNLPRGQALLEKWNLIPEGIDILITHGPPLGKSPLPLASAGPAPSGPAGAGGGHRGGGC